MNNQELERAKSLTNDKIYLANIIRQIREDLQNNQPVMAYIKAKDLEDLFRIINNPKTA